MYNKEAKVNFLNSIKVCVFRGKICLVKFNLLGSQVMFDDDSVFLTCEVAPISEFEVIGDFFETQKEA